MSDQTNHEPGNEGVGDPGRPQEAEEASTPPSVPPPPTFGGDAPLRGDEAREDPAAKADIAARAQVADEADRQRADAVTDRPVPFEIGGKTYRYTSRPIGYVEMMFAELMRLNDVFGKISNIARGRKIEGVSEALVTSEDVGAFLEKTGAQGFTSLVRVVRLLVQPIDQTKLGPPSDDDLVLSETDARWGVSLSMFAEMLGVFVARDLGGVLGQAKNL